MNSSKWNLLLIAMLALFSSGVQPLLKNTTEPAQNYKRQRRQVQSQSFDMPSYWEHILREFVFKTISPPPPGNHDLYKRLLNAEFYGGPFPIVPNDVSSVVLSRGDVYYLPEGRWLFCQQGCTDCEACIGHTHPMVKWALRRIKRVSHHGSARHDLQLTIVPQLDGSYHMRSLWPRSYVYVTSQAEQDSYLTDKRSPFNDDDAYTTIEEDDSAKQDEKLVDGEVNENLESTEAVENTTIASKKKNDVKEEETVKKHTSNGKFDENSNANGSSTDAKAKENAKVKALAPKLILGTDQTGQKHLVHVVPAEASMNTSAINSVASSTVNSVGSNKTAYHRIMRRIYESLNSNKKSIETFLEPLKQAGSMIRDEKEEHQQQETRSGSPELRRTSRYHPVYNNRTGNESLPEEPQYDINHWGRKRRGYNEDSLVDKFINGTTRALRNANSNYARVSDIVNSKLVKNNYFNGTFEKGIENDNRTLNSQDYKFPHRKYKIMVSTESSTQPVIWNRNENIENSPLRSENNKIDNRNILH